jgi:hypothetical protein
MAGNGESMTSVRRLSAAEKQRQALELRKACASYPDIARQLGYASASGAFKAVASALLKTLREPAEAVREIELARLDRLHLALWPAAIQGDPVAIDRVLKVMARRAALGGLDAPNRQELSGKVGADVKVSDERRNEFFRALGETLSPWPEAKAAVGALLERVVAENEAAGEADRGR